MLNVDRNHKAQIGDLKKDEYQVIGYVRTSSGKENASTKLRLLDSMVDRLIKDYSVDMMSASYSSTSKQPFADHDRTDPVHVPKSSGNTQGIICR